MFCSCIHDPINKGRAIYITHRPDCWLVHPTEQPAPAQIRPCTVYRHTDGKVCGQVGPHDTHFPCTGRPDCSSALHEHGCFADLDGTRCTDRGDHAWI